MKASRMRGPAGEPGLRMCASNLSITLTSIATGRAEQQKTDEAETLLRVAWWVVHWFVLFLSLVRQASGLG